MESVSCAKRAREDDDAVDDSRQSGHSSGQHSLPPHARMLHSQQGDPQQRAIESILASSSDAGGAQLKLWGVVNVADFQGLTNDDVDYFRRKFPQSYSLIATNLADRCVLVDVEEFLQGRVNSNAQRSDCPLQGRSANLQEMLGAIKYLENLGGSRKPGVVHCWSPRGMGKTALIKAALATTPLADRVKSGRVCVWCLSHLEKRDFFKAYLESHDPDTFLIRLIVDHIAAVTKCAPRAVLPTSVDEAYGYWVSDTEALVAKTFAGRPAPGEMKPLLVFDTSELLLRQHRSMRHQDGTPYTLMESVAKSLPQLHVCVAIGCDADVVRPNLEPYKTLVNAQVLGVLEPLNEDQADSAFKETWKAERDPELLKPLVELTAGIPRLLNASLAEVPGISLAHNSVHALDFCYRHFCSVQVAVLYHNDTLVPTRYIAGLCAAGRWTAQSTNQFPMPPEMADVANNPRVMGVQKVRDAMSGSKIPTVRDGAPFLFPPALLMNPAFGTIEAHMLSAMTTARQGALGPLWKSPTVERKLFVSVRDVLPQLSPDFLKRATANEAWNRGSVWETIFMHAVYVRYQLCCWSGMSSPDGWARLSDVIEGAPRGFDVNFSHGLAMPAKAVNPLDAAVHEGTHELHKTLVWNTRLGNAHHDGYLYARTTADGNEVRCLVALQLRHGQPKLPSEILAQLKATKKKECVEQCPLLLMCYQKAYSLEAHRSSEAETTPLEDMKTHLNSGRLCFIDGSQITLASCVWLITPGRPAS